MRRDLKIPIVVLLLTGLLAFLLIIIYFPNNINWEERYADNKKMPYGTSLIKKLLKNKYPNDFKEVNKELNKYFKKLKKGKTYNYIFIGNQDLLNPLEIMALDSFAKVGNTAFISAKNFYQFDSLLVGEKWINPDSPSDSFVEGASKEVDSGEKEVDTENPILNMLFSSNNNATLSLKRKKINYNFTHPLLKAENDYVFYNVNKSDTIPYLETHFFKRDYFERFEPKIIKAGYVFDSSKPNFFIIPWGKGQIIFHSGPDLFSNIALKDKQRLYYAEKVLSHLQPGSIIFDEIHKTKYFELNKNEITKLDKSPLSFILSQRSLRWAWYTGIVAILLFILFGAKRKQAVIPIILPPNNTSMEYVKTVGQLYYLDKNHNLLAKEIKTQFYNFVKTKYQLSLALDEEEKFIQQLNLKSEISQAEIKDIMNKINDISLEKQLPINENTLHEIYQITERFYKNCK